MREETFNKRSASRHAAGGGINQSMELKFMEER